MNFLTSKNQKFDFKFLTSTSPNVDIKSLKWTFAGF